MSNKRGTKKINTPNANEYYNDLSYPEEGNPIKTLSDGRIVFTGALQKEEVVDNNEEVKNTIKRIRTKTKADEKVLEDKIDRLTSLISNLIQDNKNKDGLITEQQLIINKLSKDHEVMKVSFESMRIGFESLNKILVTTNNNQEKLMSKFEGEFATLVQNILDRSPLNEVIDSLKFEVNRLSATTQPTPTSSGTVTPNSAAISKVLKKRGRPALVNKNSENYNILSAEYAKLKAYRHKCKKSIENYTRSGENDKVIKWAAKNLANEEQMKLLKVKMDEDKKLHSDAAGVKNEEDHNDNNG